MEEQDMKKIYVMPQVFVIETCVECFDDLISYRIYDSDGNPSDRGWVSTDMPPDSEDEDISDLNNTNGKALNYPRYSVWDD